MNNVVIVVPTIREQSIKEFLDRWKFTCPVIVVEDNPEATFDISGVTHYSWEDIEKDLGSLSWIIPRRTDCIRSYGYYKAWQTGADYIITLDDDCYPHNDISSLVPFVQTHINNLRDIKNIRWYNTLDNPVPRGYPYEHTDKITKVGISHGLWTNVPDYDSVSQLVFKRYPQSTVFMNGFVPYRSYYPMCGMNLAWHRDVTPLLYFLLMGQDAMGNKYQFDRFGDIWAGVISKKILDYFGVRVWSGDPKVHHNRASNVWSNFQKEHAGIIANEFFWQSVDSVHLTSDSHIRCYAELAEKLDLTSEYWIKTRKAMQEWTTLF